MKQVFTAKQIEDLFRKGGNLSDIPENALLTPSARDAIKDWKNRLNEGKTPSKSFSPTVEASSKHEPIVPNYEFKWTPGSDPQTSGEIEKFFNSPEITVIKQRIVDMGQRIWQKDYVDGNGGNITVRVGDNLVLCTPTLISKGFMTAEDICLVNMDGVQLAGKRKRTSEVNTHLGIMKRQPKAKACVHAHPPHATAFAVASVEPPTCMIPEAEVFLGKIAMAPYQTPGSPENAEAVGEIGVNNQAILMENHGVIVWGKDVEDAYWKMENVDAYCKTIWIASQLRGGQLKTIAPNKVKELIGLRTSLGMDDARKDWKECELCDNAEFRPGVVCATPAEPEPVFSAAAQSSIGTSEAEELVRKITEMIMAKLG